MQSKNSDINRFLLLMMDLLTISGSWMLAYYLRFYLGLATPFGVPKVELYIKLMPFILAIWSLITIITGTYYKLDQIRSHLGHLVSTVQSSFIFVLTLISFSYFYEEYRYSRLTILIFSSVLPFSLILGRWLIKKLTVHYQLSRKKRNTVLLSAGDCLKTFLNDQDHNFDSNIVGVIVPESDSLQEDLKICKKYNLDYFSSEQEWPIFFTQNPCEQVVISLPHGLYPYLEENLDRISDQIADVKIIPDVLRYTRFNTGIDMVGNTPIIHIHESPLKGLNCIMKRIMDILGAGFALLLFSPIMILTAILIPLSSRGPVLYRQVRMGLDGKTFKCLKFRSMPVGAEATTGAVWATESDNRATPFGSFLRKTSLDELPQLFNVLIGDMSLVGPRPERPVFVNDFRKKVPGYMLRHKVKTGITGWAQVNGWRGSTSIQRRIECDLYYIQNWSFWLDIKILLMTIEEIFSGRNAY